MLHLHLNVLFAYNVFALRFVSKKQGYEGLNSDIGQMGSCMVQSLLYSQARRHGRAFGSRAPQILSCPEKFVLNIIKTKIYPP